MAGYTNLEYLKGTPRQRGRGLGALSGKIAGTASPFRKYVLPIAMKLGKDAIEAALPELGEVIAGRSSIEKATKRIAKKTVRKQLGGKRKKSNRKKRKTIQVIKSRKKQRRSREDFSKNIF